MRIFFITTLLPAIFLPCLSQDKTEISIKPEAELFTIENGLSQTRVNVCFSDSYGFLWVGTSDGLNRYDGYGFTIYKHKAFDSTSLSHNFIRCISEDSRRRLWIGTDFGLNVLDRNTGKFKQYHHFPEDPDSKNGISDHQVLGIYESKDGFIWIKTLRFLDKLNPETGQLQHFRHSTDIFSENFLPLNCPIFEDLNRNLWMSSSNGLLSFDRVTSTFQYYYDIPGDYPNRTNRILSILSDNEKQIWIGTSNGLVQFHFSSRTFSQDFIYGRDKKEVTGIASILKDPGGILWMGTENGLVSYDPMKKSSELLSVFFVDQLNVKIGAVSSLVMDHSGILWVSGINGLFKIDTKPKKFRIYNSSPINYPGLNGDMTSVLYRESEDLIWVGIWNKGLNILNRRTGKVELYSASDPDPVKRISDNKIRCVLHDRHDQIWLGSVNGLDIFDKASRSFIPFEQKYPSLSAQVVNNRSIICMAEDLNGDIWIGTDKGVLKFLRDYGILTGHNIIYKDSVEVEMGTVYSILADSENKIWIGTHDGLYCYNQAKKEFYLYSSSGKRKDLSSGLIYSLFLDSNNTLWVGTASGLNRLNRNDDTFLSYTIEDGMANDLINSILEDENHFLWLSTNKGLIRFNKETGEFINYDISEGLQSYEFNHSVSCRASDGEMFFGGISGFNSFYPEDLPVNPHQPEIVITSIQIMDKDRQIQLDEGQSDMKIAVRDDQSVTFKFAALDFTTPASNAFEYALVPRGDEKKWIPIGTQNSLTFLNLAPGEYFLHIRGSNNDRLWNTEGISVGIVSHAPFWRTSTAKTGYILIMTLLVYFFVQSRTETLRKSNKILRERDIASREIVRQKDLLSLKNKNITDSINYAQRIQKALLTTPRQFKSILPDSFILHKPKDIVSGDFYWISQQGGKIFVVAADCTGHGVPGAFMSLISIELFRKIIIGQKIYDPAVILNTMNSNFEEIFGRVEDITIKDGMDLSMCVFDKSLKNLEFAGAFNPLYLVRDNKLIEFKADHFSIGADNELLVEPKKFIKHPFELNPGDMIYMFSDGYADQFGGPEGKKYKHRRFRHLLLNIHQLPTERQQTLIDENIEDWRGNQEQIDDILVIGIRV
jgi:ligand-binding sensor domain-containing protein/serine phosphatase RsbU (regulator of sigma subunit)